MRELTYSQDVIFSDQSLLNGLLVCSEKVWLPNRGIVDAMLQAAEDCEIIGEDIPFDLQELRRSIQSDSRRDEIFEWEDRNRLLFDEGVIERLPPSLPNEEGNVLDDLTFADMWGTWKPGITIELALHGHLGVRELVPGYALFDSKNSDAMTAASAKKAIVAAKFLALNIPKIGNLENDKLLDLREKTQEDDIKDFWEMIDFYSTMTDGNATIASIQKDLTSGQKIS